MQSQGAIALQNLILSLLHIQIVNIFMSLPGTMIRKLRSAPFWCLHAARTTTAARTGLVLSTTVLIAGLGKFTLITLICLVFMPYTDTPPNSLNSDIRHMDGRTIRHLDGGAICHSEGRTFSHVLTSFYPSPFRTFASWRWLRLYWFLHQYVCL